MTAGFSKEEAPDRIGDRRGGSLACIVADDHPVVLDAVCALLEYRGLLVQGRARDGEAALGLIAEHKPPVALVDLRLPGMSGADTAREAQRVSPGTAVIVFTGQTDVACMTEVLDAGAKGFVLKDAPLEDLMRAIDMVAAGGVYVDPALAGAFVDSRGTDTLTLREREVLRLAADGLSSEKIGERLFLSPQTVRGHVGNAMGKLQAHTRTQAVATALREQLIA
jgi:two-component system, NarL family, response regulator DesR